MHWSGKTPLLLSQRQGGLHRHGGSPSSRVRLVCFPWAGGGASAFRRYASFLSPAIELFAVQYPGREDRFGEPPALQMDHLVRQILDDLRGLLDRPLVFFGHSMGALVAYETACAIAAHEGQPRLLIVSGSGAPLARVPHGDIPPDASDEEFIADLQRMGGTPAEILENRTLMRTLLPALRADYHLLGGYQNQKITRLPCLLVACAGYGDPTVSLSALEAWRAYTAASFELHRLAGHHFYLQADPAEFARCLEIWIASANLFSPDLAPGRPVAGG